MMVYRLAYLFRVPVHRILREWPTWEILSWRQFFELVGPLDWRREDLRDARRHVFKYGELGDLVTDGTLFTEPEIPLTEREQIERDLEKAFREVAKLGPEFAEASRPTQDE